MYQSKHTYRPEYVYTNIRTNTHTYLCIYVHTYMHTYIRIWLHTHIRIYTPVHINTHETRHFVAPQKFVGAKREAYGGLLSFRHGFFEFNRLFFCESIYIYLWLYVSVFVDACSGNPHTVRHDSLVRAPWLTRTHGTMGSEGKDTLPGFDVIISSEAHSLVNIFKSQPTNKFAV